MSKAMKIKTDPDIPDSNTEHNICVTCSTLAECENVFILSFEDILFSNILNSCMGFKLSENSKLRYMCLECINTIISFHTFKEAALKSYEELCKRETDSKIIAPVDDPPNITQNSEEIVVQVIGDLNMPESTEAESDNDIKLEIDIKEHLLKDVKVEMNNVPLRKSNKPIKKLLRGSKEGNFWQCAYCGIEISKDNPAEIKRHRNMNCIGNNDLKIRQTVVGDEYLLLCCLCCEFKTNSELKFREHSSCHEGSNFFETPPRNFGCTKCGYISPRKRDVQRHVLIHLKEGELQMIPCTKCDFSTRYISSLYKHIRRIHRNQVEKSPRIKYDCDDCEFSTAYKNSLESHRLQHKNPLEQEFYYCYNCDFKTIHKTNLRSHVNLHRNREQLKKFICEICGISTIYQRQLRLHRLTHQIEKEETETEEQNMKRIHFDDASGTNGGKRKGTSLIGILLECDQCSYKTYNKKCFKVHKIRHKPEDEVTLYYCDQCSYKTRNKNNLHGHLITHKDPEKVKIYQCEYCTFRTAYSSALRIHLRRHVSTEENTLFCDQCNFKTIYRVNFLSHQNLHKDPDEVVTFSCNWCDYNSTYESNVRRHELGHHGKKRVKREWSIH